MGGIRLGQTYGHVKQSAFMNRVYYKPSLHHLVIRHPGVLRRSTKVLEINRKVRENPPATKCKGKPWDEFVRCLAREMKKTVTG